MINIARCAAGCAYHSTVGGNCPSCGGPLTKPVTVNHDGARAIIRNEAEYQAGKAAVLTWMAGAR